MTEKETIADKIKAEKEAAAAKAELAKAVAAEKEAVEKAAAESKATVEKAVAAEAERVAADEAKKADLEAAALAEAERIFASDEGANVEEVAVPTDPAFEKLRNIALDYNRSTPNEHILFGRGGITFTLGDLRRITGVSQ